MELQSHSSIGVSSKGVTQRRSSPADKEVGKKIRATRLARGLSQTKLSDRIGVSFQQLQKYESGANRVGAGRLEAIAKALGVPASHFLSEGVGGDKRWNDAVMSLGATKLGIKLARAFAGIGNRSERIALVIIAEAMARG